MASCLPAPGTATRSTTTPCAKKCSTSSRTGLGLGIIRNDSYEKHIKNQFYDYSPGDVMVIYTDGIVEARGGDGTDEYGEDRLKLRLEESYFQEAEEIKTFILDDLNALHRRPSHSRRPDPARH